MPSAYSWHRASLNTHTPDFHSFPSFRNAAPAIAPSHDASHPRDDARREFALALTHTIESFAPIAPQHDERTHRSPWEDASNRDARRFSVTLTRAMRVERW